MRNGRMPLFGELIEVYQEIAEMERMKCERPCLTTVRNVVNGVRQICRQVGLSDEMPLSALTRRKIDEFLASSAEAGLSPTSAWSYVSHLRDITARWTRSYYDERGWNVIPFDIPVCRRRAPRYERPERSLLLRVKAWYESLAIRADRRDWVAVTLMLEFAMRNGDAGRLRWSDFKVRTMQDDGVLPEVVLCYTPHKTSLTSGRIVAWPVHADIWRRLCAWRDVQSPRRGHLVLPAAAEVFKRLNRELRELKLFTGNKGCYELRKICIDHIYQKFGAEMASSISGDDIRTVTRYYADPSAVNVTGVRIVDLL